MSLLKIPLDQITIIVTISIIRLPTLLETTLLQKVRVMLIVYPSEIPPMNITPHNNYPILINLSIIYKTLEMIKKRNYVQLPAIYYTPRSTMFFCTTQSFTSIGRDKSSSPPYPRHMSWLYVVFIIYRFTNSN
jgi:hypothetical protein